MTGWRDHARRVLPHSVRARIFRARRAVRRRWRGEHKPWVRTEPTPLSPDPLDGFALYAIVGTWMEGDIIADTVANAYAQGVDQVFLVDNASPDDTVERAVASGAEHVLTYSTTTFAERYRYRLMNEFVRHRSEQSDVDHVWWLWLDADEFPRPAGGGTIRALLAGLDHRYRIVGARFLNHYPSPGHPPHVPGDHPLDHQPLAEEISAPRCSLGHRKHPLQRWDRSGPFIETDLGFHQAFCDHRPLLEPPDSLVIHHFPFRDEAVTRQRLESLWGLDGGRRPRATRGHFASDHMEARVDSLDAVYDGHWARVRNFSPERPPLGVSLAHWHDLDPPVSRDVPRWSPSDHGRS